MSIGTCHIVIRDTLDWEHASYDQLLSPFVQETARWWDATFRVDYMTCRARIKAIAQDAHRAVSNSRILEPANTDAVVDSRLQPEDVLLVCDDDDWYHPQIVEHVRKPGPLRTGLLLWPDGVYGYHAGTFHVGRVVVRALGDPRAVSGPIKTNNYAVTSAFAKRVPAMMSHASAVHYFSTTRPAYHSLGRPLSLVNRHPCSHTVWWHMVRGVPADDARSVLRTIVARYLEKGPEPQSAFRWGCTTSL